MPVARQAVPGRPGGNEPGRNADGRQRRVRLGRLRRNREIHREARRQAGELRLAAQRHDESRRAAADDHDRAGHRNGRALGNLGQTGHPRSKAENIRTCWSIRCEDEDLHSRGRPHHVLDAGGCRKSRRRGGRETVLGTRARRRHRGARRARTSDRGVAGPLRHAYERPRGEGDDNACPAGAGLAGFAAARGEDLAPRASPGAHDVAGHGAVFRVLPSGDAVLEPVVDDPAHSRRLPVLERRGRDAVPQAARRSLRARDDDRGQAPRLCRPWNRPRSRRNRPRRSFDRLAHPFLRRQPVPGRRLAPFRARLAAFER